MILYSIWENMELILEEEQNMQFGAVADIYLSKNVRVMIAC